MSNYSDEIDIRQLLAGVRDRLVVKNKTEAQALVLSTTYPSSVFYTNDTNCIVVNGRIYGRGQQLSSVFRFIPATETPGHGDFTDTSVIYVQPDGTNFILWWYSPSNTWVQTGSIAFDVATSASDISYDLTPTPDLGSGDVQSAIEAEDAKVEQLSLDTMGKDESGEYWEDLLFERKGYSEISANNRRIDSTHKTTTDTTGSNRKIYIFPASEGDVFKVIGAAGAGDWTGFWKGGTAYSSITAANYLSSANTASGTYTAPANATLFAFVSIDARFTSDLAHVWKKTTRASKTPADIQRQLIEGWVPSVINTSALEVGDMMPYWAATSSAHGIRVEVRKGQVLLLDIVGTANYAPLVFTDEDRVITEIHQTPVYGAFEAPNDGYAYIQKLISHESDNYLYVMGYGGHAKDMVRIMEDTGEVADQKIDDEKVEFIKERFPGQSIAAYILASQTKVAVSNNNDTISFIGSTATNQTARWSKLLVPKGTLIVWQRQKSKSTAIDCLGYSTVSPQNYYETNGTIVGFTAHKLIWYTATTTYTEHHTIMPEDGYIIQCYLGQDSVMNVSTSYDSSILKDYYNKGFADGSAMASIAGLGYNIWDYVSGAVDMAGFEYGCNYMRNSIITPLTGTLKQRYNNNKNFVYFPKVDVSVLTPDGEYAFAECSNLVLVPDMNYRTGSEGDCYRMFDNCKKLKHVGSFGNMQPTRLNYMFGGCTALLTVGKIDTSKVTAPTLCFNATGAIRRVEEFDFTAMGNVAQNDLFYNTNNSSLRYWLIKNIGTKSSSTSLNFSRVLNWGIPEAAYSQYTSDARQSLINTLITYSFDRATAGYSTCTITLSANTKALLTDEEIEQITAKGYTIA